MNISVNVQSGTGGYFDYDGCDLCVATITHENFPIPRTGEILSFLEDNDKKVANSSGVILKEYHQYLVTSILYWVNDNDYGVTIYVVPVGRSAEP